MRIVNLFYEDAPAAFALAAAQEMDDGVQFLGAGRGLNTDAAAATCIGEAIERVTGSWVDLVAVVEADNCDLMGVRVLPNRVWCFSSRQLSNGPHASERIAISTWRATRRAIKRCRRWCVAREHDTGDVAHVPLANVIVGGDGTVTDTNGLAAGATLGTAERSAVFELIERDAVAIWWYCRSRRPGISLSKLDEAGGGGLRRWLESRKRRTWLLDLTHDLRVPVVGSISTNENGFGVTCGFASRGSLAHAAVSAVLEMLQMELSHLLVARRKPSREPIDDAAAVLFKRSRAASIAHLPFLSPLYEATPANPPSGDVDPILAVKRNSRLPIYFVDFRQLHHAFRVVRAIIPGLRPWHPRFRRGRLQSVPKRLRWSGDPVDELSVGNETVFM